MLPSSHLIRIEQQCSYFLRLCLLLLLLHLHLRLIGPAEAAGQRNATEPPTTTEHCKEINPTVKRHSIHHYDYDDYHYGAF